MRETLDVVSQSAIRITRISYRRPEEGPLCGGGQGWGSPSRQRGEQDGQPKQKQDNNIIIITVITMIAATC